MARPGSGLLVPVNGLGYPPQNMARVVVWEWLNEHGRWRPYSAAVCHHIENVQKGDARGSVVLGQVDGQLSPYVIDLQSMHQFRQDTGERIPGERGSWSARILKWLKANLRMRKAEISALLCVFVSSSSRLLNVFSATTNPDFPVPLKPEQLL